MLNFEAGAISKSVGDQVNRVAPFLIGFKSKGDLSGPLSRFQAVLPTKSDMLKLLQSLNAVLQNPRPGHALADELEVWWPRFEEPYSTIESSAGTTSPRERGDSEKLSEVLELVRELSRRQSLTGPDEAGLSADRQRTLTARSILPTTPERATLLNQLATRWPDAQFRIDLDDGLSMHLGRYATEQDRSDVLALQQDAARQGINLRAHLPIGKLPD